jgi:signal transduction histidine kinase/CheY-like chemotaxis protein
MIIPTAPATTPSSNTSGPRDGSWWAKLPLQPMITGVLFISTVILIYFPFYFGSTAELQSRDRKLPAVDSRAVDVLISYGCVVASTASILVDWFMQAVIMFCGQGEKNYPRLLIRLTALFYIMWPPLHALASPYGLTSLQLIADNMFQKYCGMITTIYLIQVTDSQNKWCKQFVLSLVAAISLGVVMTMMLAHFDSDERTNTAVTAASIALESVAAVGLLWRIRKSFATCEDKLVLIVLVFCFLCNTVIVILLQVSMYRPENILSFHRLVVAANYEMVVVVTLPVVMPARLEKDKAQYQRKVNEFRQSFMRYISHEIRTPLNVSTVGLAILEDFMHSKILSSSSSASETARMIDGNECQEINEVMEQTKQGLAIATEILNDLLTFEKITANAMVLEQTMEPPLEFIVAAASLFEFQAKNKGIAFSLPTQDLKLDDSYLCIDTYKLSQVVRNLVSNAIKFTPAGGTIAIAADIVNKPKKTAAVSSATTVPTVEWLRISVTDTGAGIAPENIGRLFKEIIQFDANKLQAGKGTGLGMYISRSIVELHGGCIGVQSNGLDQGCTFWVELPLMRSDSCKTIRPNAISNPNSHFKMVNQASFHTDVGDNSAGAHSRSAKGMSADADDNEPMFVRLMPALPVESALPAVSELPVLSQLDSRSELIDIESGDRDRFSSKCSSVSIDLTRTPGGGATASQRRVSNRGASVGGASSRRSRLASTDGDSVSLFISSSMPIMEESGVVIEIPKGRPKKSVKDRLSSQFSTIDLRDCRVLLVDDSAMNLKMMALMMKKFGAECVDARNGEQAFDLVFSSLSGEGSHIDIVIMDNNMDVMNGPQACKLMREAGYTNPIFGLTGDVNEASDKEYLSAGANCIFRKPLNLQEVIEAMTRCSL